MTAISRRHFLVGVGAMAFLAACGKDDDDATASGSPSGSDTATDVTRKITTDNGVLEVPTKPQRVVAAIGSFETDMVAVGVMPVLTTSFAGPWVDLDDDVVITENIPPTAEELARVRPDLIVGWNWVTAEPVYDEMVKLAPYAGLGETQATAGAGVDNGRYNSWDTLFLSVADAVGRRGEAEKLVRDFERRVEAVAARRAGRAPLGVARVEFHEPGSFSYRGQNEDTAELMRRIGLTVVGPDKSKERGEPRTTPRDRRRPPHRPRRWRYAAGGLRRCPEDRALAGDPGGQSGTGGAGRRRALARPRLPVGKRPPERPRTALRRPMTLAAPSLHAGWLPFLSPLE